MEKVAASGLSNTCVSTFLCLVNAKFKLAFLSFIFIQSALVRRRCECEVQRIIVLRPVRVSIEVDVSFRQNNFFFFFKFQNLESSEDVHHCYIHIMHDGAFSLLSSRISLYGEKV